MLSSTPASLITRGLLSMEICVPRGVGGNSEASQTDWLLVAIVSSDSETPAGVVLTGIILKS